MNKYCEMSRLRILALILLVLLLSGCVGLGTQGMPTTAPASGQGKPQAAAAALITNTPRAGEAASATPQPAGSTKPTATPSPTQTPAIKAPSLTPTTAPNAAGASALAGDTYEPIPGCAPSRLHWGDVIRIAPEIEYVRIRSTADTHPADNIIRRLYRSELAKTMGFPVCNYGWILWPVQTADGTRGWVPETDGIDFWLVKANPWAFPTATIPSR